MGGGYPYVQTELEKELACGKEIHCRFKQYKIKNMSSMVMLPLCSIVIYAQ